jgi:hypothetical protein
LIEDISDSLSGWWLTYPSEKYESQLGLFFPTEWNKMFQTTNQIKSVEDNIK